MKTAPERMREFVEYHKNGDGECNGILLKAYADKHRLTQQERYDLAFFYSTVYCIPSAILMLNSKGDILNGPAAWGERNRERIIFQSDRRYVRCCGNFEKILQDYAANRTDAEAFIRKTVTGNTISVKRALDETAKWYFFGGFASYLFIETLCLLLGLKAQNVSISWQDGDTATSGLLNLFGLDKSADYFDRKDKLPPNLSTGRLDTMLRKTIFEIQKAGGETNVTEIETSLCAYRKFYKGTRYNGYYLDRQLEELVWYEGKPGCRAIIAELYRLRRENFNHQYLGELHNWKGVRKECKTLYKRTGQMM